MSEKSTANCRQKSIPNRRETERQSTRGVETREAPRRQQANVHNASDARITTFDKIEEMASTLKRRCDGTPNFPPAETVSVAMHTSDACRSRDECLHGRTQLRACLTEDLTPQENSCVTVWDCEEDDDQRFRFSWRNSIATERSAGSVAQGCHQGL